MKSINGANTVIWKIRAIIFSLILVGALFGSIFETVNAQPFGAFEPPHMDYGLDTDNDGLYNYLVVDAVVNVSVAGDYIIYADLYVMLNQVDYGDNYTFLSAGIQTVEIRFSGMIIGDNGVDGPYNVELHLFDSSWFSLDSDTHMTAAYNWTDFQTGPNFEPPHTDYGLDTDSDGLYNYLVVRDICTLW